MCTEKQRQGKTRGNSGKMISANRIYLELGFIETHFLYLFSVLGLSEILKMYSVFRCSLGHCIYSYFQLSGPRHLDQKGLFLCLLELFQCLLHKLSAT